MSPELLTSRLRRELVALAGSDEPMSASDINWKAHGVKTRLGVVKNDLGTLKWRGLAEQLEDTEDAWSITEAGLVAIQASRS